MFAGHENGSSNYLTDGSTTSLTIWPNETSRDQRTNDYIAGYSKLKLRQKEQNPLTCDTGGQAVKVVALLKETTDFGITK